MSSSLLFIVISVLSVFWILIKVLGNNGKFKKLASRFPGPVAIPILGNAHLFLGNTETLLNTLKGLCDAHSSPFRVWLGHYLLIINFNPEHIKIILNSKHSTEKPIFYDVAKPWAGNGLLTAPDSIWRVHRKLIQPTFNQKILQSFIETFQSQSIIFTEEITSNVDGKEFDVSEIVGFRTLNFICETTMGSSIMSNQETSHKYFEATKIAMQVFVDRTVKIWLTPDILFKLTKSSKEFNSSIKYMHKISNEVIKTRRKEMDNRLPDHIDETDTNKRKPFLDFMISDNKLSDKEIRDEVNTIMFAGYDTNASTTSFALLMLASHPEIQDQVYQEIFNIYGSEDPKDVPVKPEDLPRLIILERVIKETMRIFPIVPLFGRRVDEDLEIGDFTFPKDSIAVISVWKLHRDEKYWPDHLKFDPNRFLPEEVAKRHQYCYVPFSGGPRNCIGQVYAMMAIKVLLATILRKYILKKDNIKPIKDIKLKLDILLRPVDPITLRIEKRKRK